MFGSLTNSKLDISVYFSDFNISFVDGMSWKGTKNEICVTHVTYICG